MHLPVGVYLVSPDGRFHTCNDGVRNILGLSREQTAGAKIQSYYANPAHYQALVEAAQDEDETSNQFEKALVHFVVNGRNVFAEHYLKALRQRDSGEVIGYLGCMAEVTDEHEAAKRSEALQNKVKELTLDIGRIMHANTSTFVMVNQTLDACAAAFAAHLPADYVDVVPTADECETLIERKAEQLADAIERLEKAGDERRRSSALSDTRWQTIGDSISILRDYHERIPVKEMWNPALRNVAAAVVTACRSIESGRLPREAVRSALRRALELQRLVCLQDVITTKAVVAQMDFTLRSLRDFVTTEVRVHEKRRRCLVDDLIREAVKQLGDFASASNVTIVWRERAPDVDIVGAERDLVRALSNLLHNAIKYSWRRDRGSSPWVAIRSGRSGEHAVIELENWGVPITQEEIQQELIFEMGYRGQWSTDRGRLGTGIGLTDARQAARQHGGDIQVTSRPAVHSGLPPHHRDYFRRPFLTVVRMTLPLAHVERRT